MLVFFPVLRMLTEVFCVEMDAQERMKQAVAPVLATVCPRGAKPRAKKYKTQAGSLGVDIVVRKLNALNAPTVKAILETLGIHGNNNKRTNTTILAKHLQSFGPVTLARVDNNARVESNPFLSGYGHTPMDTYGPVVLCIADVRASAHIDLDPKGPIPTFF